MQALKLKGKLKPETTSDDLIRLAKLNHIRVDAIVFKDHLKSLPLTTTQIIINLANSGSKGTHWLALSIVSSETAIFYDSFGIRPADTIVDFCIDRKIKYLYYNTIEIQKLHDRGGCGEFSLYFLKTVQDTYNIV